MNCFVKNFFIFQLLKLIVSYFRPSLMQFMNFIFLALEHEDFAELYLFITSLVLKLEVLFIVEDFD
jgi:hypothetical protein